MVSGLVGSEVSRKGFRVRSPVPPQKPTNSGIARVMRSGCPHCTWESDEYEEEDGHPPQVVMLECLRHMDESHVVEAAKVRLELFGEVHLRLGK